MEAVINKILALTLSLFLVGKDADGIGIATTILRSPKGGSKSDFTPGLSTWVIPAGVTLIAIDLRGPGGGAGGFTYDTDPELGDGQCGGAGAGLKKADFGDNGLNYGNGSPNSFIKRGTTTLAQAAGGGGGHGDDGPGSPPCLSVAGTVGGTNVYTGLTLTIGGGSPGGAKGSTYDVCYDHGQATAGTAGNKVTGNLTVTPGESLTVNIGTTTTSGKFHGGFCPCGDGTTPTACDGGNGTPGSLSVTW